MNDVTLITRTLSIKPERLAMIAEALWNAHVFPKHGDKYDPLYEMAVARFIKRSIQGYYVVDIAPRNYTKTEDYNFYHGLAIYNLYQDIKA